jgi:hypothetical protein
MMLPSSSEEEEKGASHDKAQTLAFILFFLSSVYWSICAFFWALMAVNIQKSLRQAKSRDAESAIELNPLLV